jgi:hypothetical protein
MAGWMISEHAFGDLCMSGLISMYTAATMNCVKGRVCACVRRGESFGYQGRLCGVVDGGAQDAFWRCQCHLFSSICTPSASIKSHLIVEPRYVSWSPVTAGSARAVALRLHRGRPPANPQLSSAQSTTQDKAFVPHLHILYFHG